MDYGRRLANARKRKGHSQRSLSNEVNVPVSRESIAKYEDGSRKIPKDMYSHLSNSLDDSQFYFETWQTLTGQVSIPFFNGPFVVRQAAVMAHLVKEETKEALECVEEFCWYQPEAQRKEEEVLALTKELLDSAGSIMNLVALLCDESDISMKQAYQQWRMSLKARKFES